MNMARSTAKKDAESNGGGSDSGEFRSGPIAGTALISGATFDQKALQYAEVDGVAMFEGDIVLGTVEEFADANQRLAAPDAGPIAASIGISGTQFRWPGGVVPYEIAASMPNQQRITDAIAHWEASTAIRFVLRSSGNYPDFVRFQTGGGCSSNIGRRGGQQTITLGSNCTLGNAIHEIGHTVGLWHEQSREDRDTWVQIVWANIDPVQQHNFLQHISDGDDLGAYDYGSIMHYPPKAFSTNGQDTIIPLQSLPAGVALGQRGGLSQGDIAGVRAMYPAIHPTVKEIAKDPTTETVKRGFRDTFKEIRKDPIRDTLKETAKDPVRETVKELRKDPIQDTVKEVRKDPIRETLKEAGKDPVQDTFKEATGDPGTLVEQTEIFPVNPAFGGRGAMPFVMARPSRAGFQESMGDPFDNAQAELQELAEAIAVAEQQYNELVEMYDAALQQFDAMQQGFQ
jgi:hypothetical protein